MAKALEEMSAAKFVAKLCCNPKLIEKFLTINFSSRIHSIKSNKDLIKLHKILEQQFLDEIKSLPYLLRCIIPKHLVHFMVIEIMRWQMCYSEWDGLPSSYSLKILKSSHFTHKGTLDKALIAREMIQDKSLDVLLRISIAIDYFLIEDIRELWRGMSEDEKKSLRQKNFNKNDWEGNQLKKVLDFATENFMSDEDILSMCSNALYFGNEVALKNCWKWVNLSMKRQVSKLIVEYFSFYILFFSHRSHSGLFFCAPKFEFLKFLIYNENEELLKTLLKERLRNNHLLLLKQLLFWPYQDIFMKMLNLVWEKITDIHFYELLHSIVDMMKDDEICNTYNYSLILKDVWCLAPSNYKKYVISMESEKIRPSYATPRYFTFEKEGVKFPHYYSFESDSALTFLFSKLFSLKTLTDDDEKFVKLIASDVTASEKQKIVRTQGDNICESALICSKLRRADLFMECFVEKESISEFKQGFITRRGKHISDLLFSLGKNCLFDEITNWASDVKLKHKS